MNPDPFQRPTQPNPPQQPVDPWQMPQQPTSQQSVPPQAPPSFQQPQGQTQQAYQSPQYPQQSQQPFGMQTQNPMPFQQNTMMSSPVSTQQGSGKKKLVIIILSVLGGLALLAGAAALIINLVTAGGGNGGNNENGGNTSTAPTANTANEATYENGKVTFAYPSAWKLDSETYDLKPLLPGVEREGEQRLIHGGEDLILDYTWVQSSNGAQLSQDQVKQSIEGSVSFYAGYSNTDMITMLSQSAHGCESDFTYVERPKFVEHEGVPSAQFQFTCNSAEGVVHGLYFSTADTSAGTHTIVVTTPVDAWDARADDAQKVADSLRLK